MWFPIITSCEFWRNAYSTLPPREMLNIYTCLWHSLMMYVNNTQFSKKKIKRLRLYFNIMLSKLLLFFYKIFWNGLFEFIIITILIIIIFNFIQHKMYQRKFITLFFLSCIHLGWNCMATCICLYFSAEKIINKIARSNEAA